MSHICLNLYENHPSFPPTRRRQPGWIPEYPSVRKPLARQRTLTLGNDGRVVATLSVSFPRKCKSPPVSFPNDRKIGSASDHMFHRIRESSFFGPAPAGCRAQGCARGAGNRSFPAPHRGARGVSPRKRASRAPLPAHPRPAPTPPVGRWRGVSGWRVFCVPGRLAGRR